MLGIGGLMEFKNTLRFIRGNYEEAANNLLDSEMAREQKALADDRERLARQLRTGDWVLTSLTKAAQTTCTKIIAI
jgi:hypothetical protein